MHWERDFNALVILIISGVLLAAYGVQFIYKEEPCPLCMLQRIGMIGIAACCAMNLWFGIRMTHYGLILLFCILGGTIALRQISLHVCPGFASFGFPVLGLSLYTWSFIVFSCSVAFVALMLFLHDPNKYQKAPLNLLSKSALGIITFVTLANVVTTFMHCGFGPCGE